ncbi:50S ribosomal protein L10 [bacterium I07]|nr:50S ribosomal protein L10 [bacterium I07]
MPRPDKVEAVDKIAEIFESSQGVFITDFQGLDVEQMSELRQKCREADVNYFVVKNTLARLAAKKVGQDEMVQHLQGPSALAYSSDDPSAPARVVTEFAKKLEKPKIKFSLFEGVFYGPDKVDEIAALPPKDVLLSRLVGSLNGPIVGLVGSLNGILQKLVLVLDAVRSQKE